MSLNLHALSLYRIKGQEIPVLPGLLAQNPPKRAARGRENDRLVIYLNLAGNIPYTPEEYAQVTAKLAERFYQTSGSLTFALKTSIETLNAVLAERNMKTTGQGKYSIGVLVMAALRGDLLYIVQAGPTRVHWLTEGSTKFIYDPSLAGKGLGLSQNTRMYFAQAQLKPGDLLVFSANQPKEWQAALEESSGAVSLESLRRRLATITTDSLNAVLLSSSEGTGETGILQPNAMPKSEPVRTPSPTASPPPEPISRPEPAYIAPPVALPPINEPEARPTPPPEPVPNAIPERAPASIPAPSPVSAPVSKPTPAPVALPPPSHLPEPAATQKPAPAPQRIQMVHVGRRSARWMAQAIHASRDFSHSFSERAQKLIPRLLPQEEDQPEPELSSGWMIFIAVAIPILFVVLATTIYTSFGNPALYQVHYERALEAAAQTQNLTNPAELRLKWDATLDHLEQADQFRITENSKRLRQTAQAALDELDQVTRVNYQLAFATPFGSDISISRLAASDFDLYLLNSRSGNVLRAVLNGQTYSLQDFNCQPGTYDGVTVGELIDIVALPRTSPGGVTVMGMDHDGNLLYCSPGKSPTAEKLSVPATDRQQIDAFAYDSGSLYVLDTAANAVWIYIGQAGQGFSEPFFFFEQDVPNLKEAIGLAASGDDLYILHTDGHLTTCTYSRISTSPTRCADPAILVDSRPGYQAGPVITDSKFSQIFFTQAPNPAVNLLEANARSIFRFSPRLLELQNQIRGLPDRDDPLPAAMPITAITFSPNKALFIVVGGQVYTAVSVP